MVVLVKNCFGQELFWSKNCFGLKNVSPKEFWSKKNFCPKKCWFTINFVPKKFGPKKTLVRKNFGPRKKFGTKNFGPKISFCSQIYFLSYGNQLQRQRSCQKLGVEKLSKRCPMTFLTMLQTSSVYKSCKWKLSAASGNYSGSARLGSGRLGSVNM